jgi:hypothetical protein
VNPLLDEYFKRDLTEPEEEELAQRLSSMPEDTRRFVELMETHYRSLGLPDPEWTEGPLPSFFPKSGFRPFRILLCALLFLFLAWTGYSLYRWLLRTETPSTTPLTPQPTRSHEPSKSQTSEKSKPVKKHSSVPSPQMGPSGKIHEELSVVVTHPQSGLVTVKVIDPQGKEIQILYAGILPAGKRIFTWDGKDMNGSVATPGVYYLIVTSGSKVLRQEVHLGAAH